ncbi:MAG: CxxxxCH/CxxCH domain-containing protein [Myxococcota bacterium]
MWRRRSLRALALASLTVGLWACHSAPSTTEPPLEGGCRSCHGGQSNAAPPKSVDGLEDTKLVGVGAHQSHVLGAKLGRPVACNECHLVPKNKDDPGHIDTPLPAEVVFGKVSTASAATPTWNREAMTCGGTYCHGATLSGGTNTNPTWNVVDGSQSTCGSCHGLPPPAPHPASTSCQFCHAPVAGPGMTLSSPMRHADGVLDVLPGSDCNTCHGSVENAAPPGDLVYSAGDHHDRSDTHRKSIGAHQSHLGGGVLSKPIACNECHLVPTRLNDPGHVDTSTPAEVLFGSLSTSKNAHPSWDRASATCANTYCHGSTLEGGAPAAPRWTVVDGTEARCGTCHGLPPSAPHPQNERCEMCHVQTAGPNKTIANRATHVDGIVQVNTECKGCHGTGTTLAPPIDTNMHSETTRMGVGAHATHLAGGHNGKPVACTDCHLVPTELNTPGHVDTPLPAEVVFGGVAVVSSAIPAWSEADGKCSNTYCHGFSLSGGSKTTPTWTVVDGTQATCGSCHGLPPPAPHPASQACETCHAPTAGPGMTIASPALHVDGVLQVASGDCTSCHGTVNGSSAPPKDTHGSSDTTQRGVGAHASHIQATLGISRPVACNECHLVPVDRDSPGHLDSALPAEVTFGLAARTGGAQPAYDPATVTCANNYCHGATLTGGQLTSPVWTRVDGSQASCGSCHGDPPPAPHPNDSRCELCHLPTAGPNKTIANPATHIDGIVQAATGCDSCHGQNGSSSPPRDTSGSVDTHQPGVGAHATHLSGGQFGRAVACTECHQVPAAVDSPGHIDTPLPAELIFGAISTLNGHASSYANTTCSDSYCHSGLGASVPNPSWTTVDGTQAACGSCHGLPPPTPVHNNQTECTGCHLPTAGPNKTIANRATHVDGIVQVTALNCTTCHGMGSNSNPPKDMGGDTAPTDPQVGAHAIHMSGGAVSTPVACDNCHLVPAQVDSPGHNDTPLPAEVIFGGRASAMLSSPVWSTSAKTCANTYCHTAKSSGGSNNTPVWNVPNSAPCGSCHGLPPSAPHPASNNCELCHAPTAGPGQTIANRATHVDGVVQVVSTDCSSCHGTIGGSSAPPKDTSGSSDTTQRGVGAHASHIQGSLGIAAPVACNECHLVPTDLGSPGHVDTPLPAEVTFGPASRRGGASPTYDGATVTCRNNYCHGATLNAGGQLTAPVWTRVDGSQASCGTCHGAPPPAPHPSDPRCELCHLPTAGPNMTIANAATHIDGVVQAATGCDTCHGQNGSSAPPRDTAGLTDTSRPGVGAHAAHMSGGVSGKPLACTECHLVPAALDSPGHVDTPLPAEVIPGPMSRINGHTERYSGGSCTDSYCHAGVGAAVAAPSWTTVNGTQGACGSCHGLPPPTPVHNGQTECTGCHLPTAGPGRTIANRDTHVDGILQVTSLNCTTCHGMGASSNPPKDMNGDTQPTDPQVGAHAVHMSGGAVSTPVACDNCHLVPADVNSPGHVDTPLPAEVIFGGRASAMLSSPTWSTSAKSCGNTYCHTAKSTGGTNPAPVWNVPNSAPCGSCHGLPPNAPHPQVADCTICHAPTAGPNQTIANRATHVDGVLQVTSTDCSSCHGSPGDSAPPKATNGQSDTALPGVGAHRSHMAASSGISRPVACTDCHLVPADLNSPGHIDTPLPAELNFSALARTSGAPGTYDGTAGTCAVYCHGVTLSDGAMVNPIWTQVDGTQSACGACHGMPPGAPHPTDTRCEGCHLPTAGPNMTIANPATHIDGVLQASVGCDGCHGSGGNSAPPNDLDGASNTALPTVGAHRSHLSGGVVSKAVSCDECHLVPAQLNSPGHVDTPRPAEVIFGPLSDSNGHNASYTNPRCSDSYCHSGSGAAIPNPSWTTVNGTQAACGSCHGLPPPTPVHNGQTECTGCHLPTAGPGRTIANRDTHVDGILQVTSLNCMTCHGMGSTSNPPRDIAGNTAPTDPQVGAHAAHTSGGSVSTPVACDNCHLVPSQVDSPGHIDTALPAEVIFSGRASANQTTPAWDTTAKTCTNTYCHGALSTNGTNPDPTWNAPGTAACGSCHGLPPAAPHPQVDKCEVCHADAGPNHTITDRTRHVDGRVDVNDIQPCQRCHGTATNAAPPADLSGATTGARVGAHQRHLVGTGNSLAVPCSECHTPVNPATPNQAGHYDTAPPAEMTFGALARTGNLNPDLTGSTCNNTYCHGVSLPGGTHKNPSWTEGAQACDACHGMPPPDTNHGNGTATQCEACHTDTAGRNHTIINASKHINGVVETAAACDSCHGQSGNSAPPRDLNGQSTGPKVGVHAAHMSPTISAAVACGDCHLVPATYASPGHADTPPPAEVSLIGRARLDGAAPTYVPATETCNNTYCHGTTLQGGATSVVWSDTSGTQRACTACHGMPPATPAHNGQGPNSCQSCHADVAGAGQTIIAPSLHVDGVVQSSGGGCDSCHGSPPAPGRESYAGSAGAHAQHATTLGYECATCHGNNGSGPQHNQGNGTVVRANVNIVFNAAWTYSGGTTMNNGSSASYTQSSKTCRVGCHNPIVNNPNETPALTNTVVWANSTLTCVQCHEGVATAPPRNHNIAAQGDAACTTCHDMTNHTQGTRRLRDPDTTDALAVTTGNINNLCKTCHDGTGGTAFGNQTASNVNTPFIASAHGTHNYQCTTCHSYHSAATTGPLFVDKASATCMQSGCHNNLATDFGQVNGTIISHHRIEGGTGIAVNCNDCHNAHVSQASPNAAVNPDSRYTIYAMPTTARTNKRSSGDYRAFCLTCHDGTPPPGVTGALNINAALSGGTEPTQFKTPDGSQHRKNHSGYNCQNCHSWHGTTGSAGTNRGRMLYTYLSVRTFPYTGKSSCSTSPGGSGFNFSCH